MPLTEVGPPITRMSPQEHAHLLRLRSRCQSWSAVVGAVGEGVMRTIADGYPLSDDERHRCAVLTRLVNVERNRGVA